MNAHTVLHASSRPALLAPLPAASTSTSGRCRAPCRLVIRATVSTEAPSDQQQPSAKQKQQQQPPKQAAASGDGNTGKEDMGFLTGVTGGFAGGEVGLQQYVAANSGQLQKKAAAKAASSSPQQRVEVKPGTVYVGKGRFIEDDVQKYPTKENLGFLEGVTGGFVGGERGIKALVQDGELRLKDPNEGPKQFSPVAFAGLIAVAGALGGQVLLNTTEGAEKLVESAEVGGLLAVAPVDDNTKLLLEAALVLLGVVGTVAVGRAVTRQLERLPGRVAEAGTFVAKQTIFWVALFFAVRYIVEQSN